MTKFKVTIHDLVSEGGQLGYSDFSEPEGFYFHRSHLQDRKMLVIWKGRPTPPSLVRLCNELVRRYNQSPDSQTPLVAAIEAELAAHGLTELA